MSEARAIGQFQALQPVAASRAEGHSVTGPAFADGQRVAVGNWSDNVLPRDSYHARDCAYAYDEIARRLESTRLVMRACARFRNGHTNKIAAPYVHTIESDTE